MRMNFKTFLMYIKESELTVIGRAKIAKEKQRKVKKSLHTFFVCFLETKRFGASSEEFEVLPVCPPVC